MLFYFVRHGQTDANRSETLAGSGLDHPLNETGHQQARDLARQIRSMIAHPVHRLISSQMQRARQTAGYLSQELGLPTQINPGLREWDLGEWEGRSYEEFGSFLLDGREPERGEKRHVFYDRVSRAWREEHSPNEPYIIVSHGGVWLAMQDVLKIPRFRIENCSLVRVEAGAEGWRARLLR